MNLDKSGALWKEPNGFTPSILGRTPHLLGVPIPDKVPHPLLSTGLSTPENYNNTSENVILGGMCRSKKGWLQDSEFSIFNGGCWEIFQIYSSIQSTAFGPSCCLLARKMWSSKRLPLITHREDSSPPHLQELQWSGWSWWARNHCQLQMDSQMERKDVLKDWAKCSFKNQGVSQKDPWWHTFTGLFFAEVWSGGGYGDSRAEKFHGTCVGAGDALWEPARSLQKHDRWFLESETKPTHSNLCCLPLHHRDGDSGCAGDGAACQGASHPLNPVSALSLPSSPTKVGFNALGCQQPGC